MTKESSMKSGNLRILTINGGSSSIKFVLYQTSEPVRSKLSSLPNLLGLPRGEEHPLSGKRRLGLHRWQRQRRAAPIPLTTIPASGHSVGTGCGEGLLPHGVIQTL
jgi:hypothetical protein